MLQIITEIKTVKRTINKRKTPEHSTVWVIDAVLSIKEFSAILIAFQVDVLQMIELSLMEMRRGGNQSKDKKRSFNKRASVWISQQTNILKHNCQPVAATVHPTINKTKTIMVDTWAKHSIITISLNLWVIDEKKRSDKLITTQYFLSISIQPATGAVNTPVPASRLPSSDPRSSTLSYLMT